MEKPTVAGQVDVGARTYRFALRIVRLAGSLGTRGVAGVLGRQVLRSGTSIGANICESRNASTRKEFFHLMNIARREAAETSYWLSLISDGKVVPGTRLRELRQECDEIARILGAAVKKRHSSAPAD